MDWHDFRTDRSVEWGSQLQAGGLSVCLNYTGEATIETKAEKRDIGPSQVALCAAGPEARRQAGFHRYLLLTLTPGFVCLHFGESAARLRPAASRLMREGDLPAAPEVMPMPIALLAARSQLLHPPVPSAALRTWFLGRALEILAQTLFREEDTAETADERRMRQTTDRIALARHLIDRDYANPPSLVMLAEQVGYSPFHLSRVFAQETGMSIPKFLRLSRLEKAAELLRTGKANVSEAAAAVGYASLSAFSKAFVEHFGCCPGLYPAVLIAGRRGRGGLPRA